MNINSKESVYIVVLSDTHIPNRGTSLPKAMEKDLIKADLIIHAGDWQIPEVAEDLKKYAPVEGVTGNVDGKEMTDLYPKKKKLTINEITIGITHGDGRGKTTEKRAIEAFKEEDIDLLIFGHSHIPLLKENMGLTIFNPGSPTDKRRQPRYSYGVVDVGENFYISHVFFDDKK